MQHYAAVARRLLEGDVGWLESPTSLTGKPGGLDGGVWRRRYTWLTRLKIVDASPLRHGLSPRRPEDDLLALGNLGG